MTGVKTNKTADQRVLGVTRAIQGIANDEDVTAAAVPVTAVVAVEAVIQKRLPVEVKFMSAAPPDSIMAIR